MNLLENQNKIIFNRISLPGIPLPGGGNSAKFLSSAKRTSCSNNVVSRSRSFGVLSRKQKLNFHCWILFDLLVC